MATNFTSATPSINAALNAAETYGPLRRVLFSRLAATTAANTTSGSISLQKALQYTFPTVGTGVGGYIVTSLQIDSEDLVLHLAGYEKDLGTLAVSGNSFSGSASMPTKTVLGESLTTAACMAFVVVTAALTATTPVLTITYTDQDGNTSQTASLTLPTNAAVNSAFFIQPHLASNDTGIRSVTNMSISTGSAGTLKVFGMIPLNFNVPANCVNATVPLMTSLPPIMFESGDTLGIYKNNAASSDTTAFLVAVPETT